jgi:Aerotolerance regulator N-terminal
MSFGAFAFLNPWLLGALATLPLIYWLLRTIPPRPRQVAFPATRILVGIENREKTPSKTPWWLLLIRLLAAALVIAALAEPVINPSRDVRLAGTGPLIMAGRVPTSGPRARNKSRK